MNRLREETQSDQGMAYAVDLLRAYRPPRASTEDYRQVRASLEARVRSRQPKWPQALAVVLLFLAVNAAAQVAWRIWKAPQTAPTRTVSPHHETLKIRQPREVQASSVLLASGPSSSSPPGSLPGAMPPRRSAATPPPSFALHLARSRSTVDGLDAGKLLSAMRVLRREHDPKLAEELLAQYRAHHPSNELSEEALALAIEAAALRNRVVTAELAAEYLRRFPGGRFSALAVEARARFGHGPVP